MALKVSDEIIEFIRNSEYDKDTQDFLIDALDLEFTREKEDARNYFKSYDELVSKYVKDGDIDDIK